MFSHFWIKEILPYFIAIYHDSIFGVVYRFRGFFLVNLNFSIDRKNAFPISACTSISAPIFNDSKRHVDDLSL